MSEQATWTKEWAEESTASAIKAGKRRGAAEVLDIEFDRISDLVSLGQIMQWNVAYRIAQWMFDAPDGAFRALDTCDRETLVEMLDAIRGITHAKAEAIADAIIEHRIAGAGTGAKQ
jgi:hypothetical protein